MTFLGDVVDANIVLIGAGQLGSRYLQGLVEVPMKLSITVVEPSVQSLSFADKRWIEAGGEESFHSVHWRASLDNLPKEIDLAIVATCADSRSQVVSELSKRYKVKYWVLEKVLAQSKDQLTLLGDSVAGAQGCWVNTPRRMMAWHRRIKETLIGQSPLHMHRCGGLWGLACNSIHFIDLVAWWTGEKLDSISTVGLDHSWFESKRTGFYEVAGVLEGTFSDDSTLRLEARSVKQDRGLIVETSNGIWNIDESAGIASDKDGQTILGTLEYQSTMTNRLISSIFEKGVCDLPTYTESAQMHAMFIDALLCHWNQTQHRNETILPIT